MARNTLMVMLASLRIESNELNYAFASLLLYDHILCIGEEVEYFWTGPWSLSRLLYLSIRYMTLGFALFSIIPQRWTTGGFHETFLLVKYFVFIIPINALCQSVITLRVWYLFSRNLVVRTFAIAILLLSTISTVYLFVMMHRMMHLSSFNPLAPSSPMGAWLYVPSFVIHTILFTLKVHRFLTSSVKIQTNSFLWRFMKEGMFMYACASVSLLLGVVTLTTTEPSQLPLREPAISGIPILAMIVISVCRAMLNIRSLAATSHVDPEWLLNHAELSRVHWRRGNVAGEIVVETQDDSEPSTDCVPLDELHC